MPGLADLLAGDPPLVAASFEDVPPAALSVQAAAAAGIDVHELRVDRFPGADPEDVARRVAAFAGRTTLLTVRSAGEGGDWRGPEALRLALFRRLVPMVGGVDVELSAGPLVPEVVALARGEGRVVVVSFHDFGRTPSTGELEDVVGRAVEAGADHVKVSTLATGTDDVSRLAALTVRGAGPRAGLITIAMGAHGSLSRVFFPALGSRLTYARVGLRPAPGQLPLAQTVALLEQFYPGYAARRRRAAG